MRLILLLSALLSAIAGYTPAAAARPVEAGQVLCVAEAAEVAATVRPANIATPSAELALTEVAPGLASPLYADRLLI
ncbi:MAG TPA: hypothetical protein VL405_02735 [Sphingomonas sp.]|nr:hypothetical protein [Sphingomonas sp.]